MWERCLAVHPDDPFTLRGRGLQYLSDGRPDLALPFLEAARARMPDDPKVYFLLCAACARLGRGEEAAAYEAEWLRLRDKP